MNARLYSTVIVLVFLVPLANTQSIKCASFDNINIRVKEKNKELMDITSFSGTIDGSAFENKTLVEVNIRKQDIESIGAECVTNMSELRTLVFWGCPVRTIMPGALKNLPGLLNLQISVGNLTTIPAGVFDAAPTLKLIRLHDNFIHSIEDRAFANLPNLTKLFMGNNKIRNWENSWFYNTASIEILDMQGNKLENIPSKAFLYMNNLKQVFFDENEIRTIEPDSFLSIQKLDYLGLRYNRLKELNEDVFPNKLSVRSLLIDANYLNYLSNEVLKKLSVKDITLDGNPWKCPCLDRIHYWIYTKNITLRTSSYCNNPNIPLCIYPDSYSTTCLENNDEKITNLYKESLRNLTTEVNRHCARLD
ncbi:phospholipase A2 inhibitor-like isoform X2 [Harmonia axyridis]|uniref:phospholipase A2 inhibitor-like isoform X2 n=1 Tax=Harmonia axyridis TaxID=115357 RepID=UPI001E2780B0|nr:phospholipase A2 inhibitor-like isoform X2 [Harmonia axyridis]